MSENTEHWQKKKINAKLVKLKMKPKPGSMFLTVEHLTPLNSIHQYDFLSICYQTHLSNWARKADKFLFSDE